MTTKPRNNEQSLLPSFSALNYRRLAQVVKQLYAARFRKKPAEVVVEFESAGKWYRVHVDSDRVAREILGALWIQSHHEAHRERLSRRREKSREDREFLATGLA